MARARMTYRVGGLVGIGPPACQPVVTLNFHPPFCSTLLSSARSARARTAPQHWADGRGCHLWAPKQAAPAARALRGPRANNIPCGGTGRDWSPPCQPVVTLNFHPPFCSTLLSSARSARARTAPQHWADGRGCHLWAPKQAAPAARALRGPRANNIPCGGTGRDCSPPCQPVVTLNFRPLFCSTLLSSARSARARTAPQHWADGRGCHLWAPKQAAPAGRALRGPRANNIPCGGTGRDCPPPASL